MRLTGENKGIALTVSAVAAVTVAGTVIILRRRQEKSSKEKAVLRENYLPALQEVARKFFHICRDVAEVAKRVRKNVMDKGLQDQVTDIALRQQMTAQCGVIEKLGKAQEAVASAHKCTIDDMKRAQEVLQRSDKEVKDIADSFQTMLNDALGGEEPVMPGISIPTDENSQQKVLDLYSQIHQLARRKVYEHIAQQKSMTMQQLVPVITDCHNDATSEVLRKNSELLGSLLVPPNFWGPAQGEEVYYSALTLCSRIPAFVAKREKEDENFKQKMKEMLSLGSAAGQAGAGQGGSGTPTKGKK